MKTHYNLSEIMHNAHRLFKTQKGKLKSFGDCLRAAWKAAKSYIGRSITMVWMWGDPTVRVQQSVETSAAIAADYRQGRYMGD